MFKKIIFSLFFLFVYFTGSAQRVGVGTSSPLARLAVDSAFMLDQSNSNIGLLNQGALLFGNDGNVGISRSFFPGSSRRNGLSFYTNNLARVIIDSTGRVGIGDLSPSYPLQVSGTMASTSGIIGSSLSVGRGYFTADYPLHGTVGYFEGYMGIGTIPTASYKLDVDNGSVRFRQDARVDGILNPNNALTIGNNTTIQGSLVVFTNKGVVRNTTSNQLRLVINNIELGVTSLAPGYITDSGIFPFSETFATAPMVFMGGKSDASNESWHNLEFIPFDITTTGCRFRVVNRGIATVTVTDTYNILVIGVDNN